MILCALLLDPHIDPPLDPNILACLDGRCKEIPLARIFLVIIITPTSPQHHDPPFHYDSFRSAAAFGAVS